MLIVQDKLVSDEIVTEHFLCDLNACKGACCWEGDLGAPLEERELPILSAIYEKVKPFLLEEGQKAIAEQGKYIKDKDNGYSTPLIHGGACAYMTYDVLGIAKCGIEAAYLAGKVSFHKPISCHLYPIRVNSNDETGFEALNYETWSICSAACTKGKKEKLPVYKFVKDAIVRKYGIDFYEELDGAAEFLKMSEE
jgi:Protein of unknown function (DUF3109)